MQYIQAILNDLDGLLVNSEELYFKANKIYFTKFKLRFTEEMHRQGTGRKFDKWIKTVFPDLQKSGEEVLKERNEIFFDVASDQLELLPGALKYLKMVSKNFKNALVTSSRKDYLEIVFRKTGIETYIDVVIDGSMVMQGKPDPECYLLAANKLAVVSDACLVVEDAPAGVLAGKSAGMTVVAVPSKYVMDRRALQGADYTFPEIKSIELQWLKALKV